MTFCANKSVDPWIEKEALLEVDANYTSKSPWRNGFFRKSSSTCIFKLSAKYLLFCGPVEGWEWREKKSVCYQHSNMQATTVEDIYILNEEMCNSLLFVPYNTLNNTNLFSYFIIAELLRNAGCKGEKLLD